jgi:probable FeS assembly SUF system protein SufT
VTAIEIPAGIERPLPEGTEVEMVHELGGDFTVRAKRGVLYRINGRDADAIGRERVPSPAEAAAGASGEAGGAAVTDDVVRQTLSTVYDPEIPVDILNLGLIYETRVEPVEGGADVHVKMTLTAPGCGMGQVVVSDVERKLRAMPGVREVKVDLVFDPPWSPELMSEDARLQVGLV